MKFKINKTQFVNALNKVQGSIDAKPSIPILGNVMVVADNDHVKFTTNNISTSTSVIVDCEVDTNGETTIPAKKLVSIIKNLPNADISFDLKGDSAQIKCQRSKFKLKCSEASDWVPFNMSESSESTKVLIDYDVINKLYEYVYRSASTDVTRAALSGILFSFNDGQVKSVSTDGRRLSTFYTDVDSSYTGDMIIPIKTLADVVKSLSGKIDLSITDSCVEFSNGNISISSKLIDGNFPNYKAIIPNGDLNEIEINRKSLLDAVSRTSVIFDDNSSSVGLDFTGDILNVFTTTSNDESSESIECKTGRIKLAFNPSFLVDALKSISSDTVTIKYTDEISPCVIDGDEGFLCVIMPMRN